MSDLLDNLGAQLPEENPLRRAHSIVLSAGGDTVHDLVSELHMLAERIARGELTKGCGGGPTRGSIYSYINDPDMTHDRYFDELNRRLVAGA